MLRQYGTDVFILNRFPTSIRPFYSMPFEDGTYCNAFDVFIRGEEVISGSQRIHSRSEILQRIRAAGIGG